MWWLPWWLSGKESTCQCRRSRFDPWVRSISWRRKWQPTPVFLPVKSHQQRNLVGYTPWGCRDGHNLATTQQWFKWNCFLIYTKSQLAFVALRLCIKFSWICALKVLGWMTSVKCFFLSRMEIEFRNSSSNFKLSKIITVWSLLKLI